jgi:ATP-dependent Clp protease adaptor protein ClpS
VVGAEAAIEASLGNALAHRVRRQDGGRCYPPAMGGEPGGPIGPGGNGPAGGDPRREGGALTATRKKVTRPPRYKVILYNDDYTPMEFVVGILERVFGKGPSEATAIMLAIHNGGLGVAGVYVLEVAETKVAVVHQTAQARGYPLRAGVEKE